MVFPVSKQESFRTVAYIHTPTFLTASLRNSSGRKPLLKPDLGSLLVKLQKGRENNKVTQDKMLAIMKKGMTGSNIIDGGTVELVKNISKTLNVIATCKTDLKGPNRKTECQHLRQ